MKYYYLSLYFFNVYLIAQGGHMKAVTTYKQQLIKSLSDAGCSDEMCESCAECYENEELGKMLLQLKGERKCLREKLTKVQFELDTLDYLIRKIEQKK